MDATSTRILLGTAGAGEAEDYWVAFYLNQYVGINSSAKVVDDCRLAVDGLGNVAFTFKNDTTYTGGNQRVNIVKFDDTGSLTFQKKISLVTEKASIGFDSQNNLYLSYTATASNPNSFGQSVGLMKISSTGSITWQKAQGNTYQNHKGGGIAFDSSDNIYVESRYDWTGSDKWGYTEFNSSGTVQETKSTYGTVNLINDIQIDSSNNIYIAGGIGSSIQTSGVLAKVNSAGTLQWGRANANGKHTDRLALDGSENILQFCTNPQNIYKRNSSGTLQWQKGISGGSSLPRFITGTMTCDNSDNVYLGVTIANQYQTSLYAVIVKLNSSGSKVWEREVKFYRTSTGNTFKTRIVNIVAKKSNLYVYGIGDVGTPLAVPFIMKIPNDGTLTNTLSISAQSPHLTQACTLEYSSSNLITVSTTTETITSTSPSFSNQSGLSTASTNNTVSNTVGTGGVSPIIDLDDL